jgi:acetyl-CoA synthetase
LIESVGIATCEEYLVSSRDEAVDAWRKVNGTVVMKIASPDFPHRSDHGLVRLGIESSDQAAETFTDLLEQARAINSSATIQGVVLQRQLEPSIELLVGATIDDVIGPAVTVGFGGTLAELLGDTAVRPVPLSRSDVREMLKSLRGYAMLEGFRGSGPVNVEAVVTAIVAVASLVSAADGRLAELDINPLMVSDSEPVAVDVLAVANGTPEDSHA